MPREWILRVGDGSNFWNSSKYKIWGIRNSSNSGKHFIKNVKVGDRLWFVTHKSQGKIIAVATYESHNERILGPLINATLSNEELGWNGSGEESNVEIHYSNLFGLYDCNLLTKVKAQTSIIKYNQENCSVNLEKEYNAILRSWDNLLNDCF